MTSLALPAAYQIRSLPAEEFRLLWKEHVSKIFDDQQMIFRPASVLDEAAKSQFEILRKRMGDIFCVRMGLFHNEKFVGWSWGFQESAETFYMCNSAVLPEHRRKGLYTALMQSVLNAALAEGFQRIYSRHNATNNAVIIPKLKAGFYITHLELSDSFGTLVNLSYLANPLRRKVLQFRAGDLAPDEEIREIFKI